jgi:hypothetical protein
MKIPFDISPREALAAPATEGQTKLLSIVIILVSVLSILGAGFIILSFVVRHLQTCVIKQPRYSKVLEMGARNSGSG